VTIPVAAAISGDERTGRIETPDCRREKPLRNADKRGK
jgi:hypothetical protein